MAFYGAIEQVLTGWIFDCCPAARRSSSRPRRFVVETICGGLEGVVPTPATDAGKVRPESD